MRGRENEQGAGDERGREKEKRVRKAEKNKIVEHTNKATSYISSLRSRVV